MSFERLQRALETAETWRADLARCAPETLLAAHPDLRDLLEPLLVPEPGDAEAGGAPDIHPCEDGSLAPGTVLGEYRILGELGRGGMGVVYEAQQTSLDRRVALKVLPSTTDPTAIARFKREATIAGKLTHPGIVRVLGVGSSSGLHYFAMELVAGAALTGAHDLGIGRAVAIVAEVADALEHAHEQGVLHRDVKPGNILLCADGRAVLTDFGLARDEDLPSLSRSGSRAGTPSYMAPEQCTTRREQNAIGPHSDVFSLGVTLYEVLTGKRPFVGETAFEVMHAILKKEPVPPQRINRDLAPDLAAIVMKAIEKEPADRYATAAALAADLRAFLAYRPVSALRPSGLARLRRFARREPAKVALGALFLLALGLAIYVLATSGARAAGAQRQREEAVERLLAEGYFELQRATGAEASEQAFVKARELDPGSLEALAGIALAQTTMGKADQALATLDLVPGTPALAVVRAAALRKKGDAVAAERLEGVEIAGSDSLAKFLLANTRLTTARLTGNKQHAQEALAMATGAVMASRRSRMSFHILRGLAAAEAEVATAATESAGILEGQWPDAPETRFCVGTIVAPFDRVRAIAAFEGYLRERPDAYRALGNLANCYFQSGQPEKAIATIERAIALAPRDGIVRSRLAWFLYSTGDLDGAASAVMASLELLPEHEQSWLLLAAIRAGQHDMKAAIIAARRAVEYGPGRARNHYVLSQMLLTDMQIEQALRPLRQACELDPAWAEPHVDVARVHAALGRPGLALAAAQAAIERAPAERDRILAEVREHSNAVSLADRHFRDFLEGALQSRPASATSR